MKARGFRALARAVAGVTLSAGALMAAAPLGAAEPEWQLPQALESKLEALSPEQRSFITAGGFLQFMPARQLELETRDAAGIPALRSCAAPRNWTPKKQTNDP
jgi:hypothetical protein